jgi:hypothetical protein
MCNIKNATVENIKIGQLVAHKNLKDSLDNYRLALVIDGDDGYGDVGIVFVQIPDQVYYFEINKLLIFED